MHESSDDVQLLHTYPEYRGLSFGFQQKDKKNVTTSGNCSCIGAVVSHADWAHSL